MPKSRQTTALDQMGAKIAAVFNEADLHDAKETLRDCLMATRTMRSGHDDSGRLIYQELPDYPIRLAASVKIIEWTVGKPVSHSIVANISAEGAQDAQSSSEDLLSLLLAAPDAAASIVAKLQAAAQKAKKAEPVEVTVTPSLPENRNPSA